jgi:predicted kinase
MIGIPASGKSTTAKKLKNDECIVLSSDDIREEIFGEGFPTDEKERQKLNTSIFNTIKKEAKTHLLNGKSVVIDATNLNRKKRIKLLAYVDHIPCHKKAMLFIISPEVCKARNALRDKGKMVPNDDMDRLMKSFETPVLGEGWDEIIPIIGSEKYEFPFELLANFNQDNPHHTLTLGGHMDAAKKYAEKHGYSEKLTKLCALHDIGKLYTKQFANYKGDPSKIAHFYGHENLGAYLYLAMELCGKEKGETEIKEILYEAALINCHMRPLTAWRDSLTAKERDKALFGERFVCDIEKINAADRAAH